MNLGLARYRRPKMPFGLGNFFSPKRREIKEVYDFQ